MRSIRTAALTLAAGAVLAMPGSLFAQAPAELPQAHDDSGNAVETYAIVNGEMVTPPAIPMGDPATIAAIFDEGVNNSQVMDILTHLSESIGPRLTGSTNVETANNWARELFESWGLDNAHLAEWGTVAMRFDRGPTWGKAYQGRTEYDIKALTTLAWVPGTEGPTRGEAVRLPQTLEEFEAVKDSIAGAWIIIPTDYSGRRGIRGVTGNVRARYQAREDIRENGAKPSEPVVTRIPNDPFDGPWEGALSGGVLGDMRYPMTLTINRDGKLAKGRMSVGESAAIAIDNGVIEDGYLTFEWESPRGRSAFEITNIDGELTGTGHRTENPDIHYNVDFTRPDLPDVPEPEPGSDAPNPEEILAMVLEQAPAGFVSGSKDERVWTTSATGWRELTPDTLARDLEVIVSGPDYDWINSRIADGANVELEFDMNNTLTDGPIPVYNTIAEITGTEFPDEVVIVSAHLDSWDGPGSQGTTDNGTGSSVTLEAARILAAVGARPKRTIRFILWTGEEQGLLGSAAYVESLSEEEQAKVVCCFVDDGGTNTQGGLNGLESMRDYLAAATAPINGRIWDETDGKYLNVNVKTIDTMPQGGGSDHASFNQVGIPGFFWDEVGRSVYGYGWHTQHDALDLAIPNYLRQSATNTAIAAYNLACAPEMLSRDLPEETETETETDSEG